jgi:hypothetical protein
VASASERKGEDPKARGIAWGLRPHLCKASTRSLECLVAPANAGNPSVSVPNNLHAALACVGVIIIVCARGPLSVRLTVSRAVVGAIASILPELAAQAPVNWSVPVGAWSKDDMLALLNTAFRLMRRAMAARDFGERPPVRISLIVSGDFTRW